MITNKHRFSLGYFESHAWTREQHATQNNTLIQKGVKSELILFWNSNRLNMLNSLQGSL